MRGGATREKALFIMSRWARPHGTAPAGAASGTVYAGFGPWFGPLDDT